MLPENGRQSGDVLRVDVEALLAQPCKRFLHADGVPVRDGIECQAERSQPLFLPLPQGVRTFAPVAMADPSGELVAKLLPVELDENAAPEVRVVDAVQDVQGLDEASQMHEGPRERGGAVPRLQDAHDARSLEMAEPERTRESDQVFPVVDDELDVDGSLGDFAQGAVLCGLVRSPETRTADVGQAGAEPAALAMPISA